MLTVSPETVFFILMKAREFDEKVAPTGPHEGSSDSDGNEREVLEDFADDPTYEELMGAMESLNEDEMIDLIALAWVGRGDYGKDEWNDARRYALDMRNKHIPDYLAGMPQLSDYLEEGLTTLGYSIEEFEMGRL